MFLSERGLLTPENLLDLLATRRAYASCWAAGDRTQPERARPALERLGDRQFLRPLDAVAATLR
jgi:hypothetical protein